MAKKVDYCGASKRHYQDAELLISHNRFPNAGHLFGFAAECGIKALLIFHGLQTDPSGDIEGKVPYKSHIDVLINHVPTFSGSRGYSKYLGMIPNIKLFSNWNVKHRYYHETSIPPHTGWQKAAREVLQMLDQAKLDGVIK